MLKRQSFNGVANVEAGQSLQDSFVAGAVSPQSMNAEGPFGSETESGFL